MILKALLTAAVMAISTASMAQAYVYRSPPVYPDVTVVVPARPYAAPPAYYSPPSYWSHPHPSYQPRYYEQPRYDRDRRDWHDRRDWDRHRSYGPQNNYYHNRNR